MNTFADLVDELLSILSGIVPLIFGLTLLVIVWKLVDAWIISGGDPEKIAAGKQYALIGILVLVVMSSLWAIVYLLRSGIFGA
jgi:hypothetical protein